MMRGLGALLPPEARQCEDPYGVAFGGTAAGLLDRALHLAPELTRRVASRSPLLIRNALWIQLRTRVLDDMLRDFVAAGGRQILLLGAGYDCRAARFHREIGDGVVFEVDHPATQARKREVLARAHAPSARVVYLPWNFEREPMSDLPGRLAALGHDAGRPTLTIWEGVTMYLSEPAIDATVAAVRDLSAPESRFAFTWFTRAYVEGRAQRGGSTLRRAVKLVGEPFRFGWEPSELPGWLAPRGFTLVRDEDDTAIAAARLSPELARQVNSGWRRISLARREAGGGR